jgi:hypothetical protein
LFFQFLSGMDDQSASDQFHVSVNIEFDFDQAMIKVPLEVPLEEQTVEKNLSSELNIQKPIECNRSYKLVHYEPSIDDRYLKITDSDIAVNIEYDIDALEDDKTVDKGSSDPSIDDEKPLEKKMRTDVHPKLVQCPKCPRMYCHSGLQTHLSTSHVDKSFKCQDCDFSTDVEKYLRSHRKSSHKKEQFQHQCRKCDRRYEFPNQLRNHRCTKVKTQLYADGCFKCQICEFEFSANRTLKMHYKKTHDTLPPGAEQLQHVNKTSIKKVTSEPDIQKPFGCPHCEKAFKYEFSLIYHHKEIHQKKKTPFKCDQCEESFELSDSLKLHIRTMHERCGCVECANLEMT